MSKPEDSEKSPTRFEGTEEASKNTSLFRRWVLEGTWDKVIFVYGNQFYHKIKINESRGTALHVAVNDGKLEHVRSLVEQILRCEGCEGSEEVKEDSALKSTNERGDTPLHLAASRGFVEKCKSIIGENGERKNLIRAINDNGETPLFRAVFTCQTKAFVYLYHVSKDLYVLLRNKNKETILHCAIRREFLELAIIIAHCYPGLVDTRDKDGVTPFKLLAYKPSAFTTNLSWWKKILYHGIHVEPLDAEKAINSYMYKDETFEEPDLKGILVENDVKRTQNVEQKYASCILFVKIALRFASKCLSLSGLDVNQLDLKAIKKIRQKHKWGIQLLDIFMQNYSGMETPAENINNIKKDPLPTTKFENINIDSNIEKDPFPTTKFENINIDINIKKVPLSTTKFENIDIDVNIKKDPLPTTEFERQSQEKTTTKSEKHVDDKETVFLAAAKNGVVEIVSELVSKIPSVVHETNSNNENVLLVAVNNRQTNVVEELRKRLDKDLFDSLILEVDNNENTVLHLAAGTTSNTVRTWQIAGAAMQMMWDMKWYQYVSDLVPDHFTFRTNKDDKTSAEIFKEKHQDLVNDSSDWLKEAANSCSVVAALIAGVSFATSSTVPGGTDKGKPALEGHPAFDAFAIASLIGLCFSVTALIMFLAILTSRKQAQDFQKSLPLKLLFGLSSLFVSIASMLVSFCTAHFFVLEERYRRIMFPVYVATCLPITFYAVVQFPLYADLLKAIFKKVPQPSIASSQF